MDELRIEAKELNQQASLLIKTGNADAAMEKLDKAIDIDPMCFDSYKNYGDLYMSMEKYIEAENAYKKAMLIEKKPELYFNCGNACFMTDDVHRGLEYYNLALTSGFDNEEMLFFMGMAYEHLNDDHMASRYFQKACIKNPSRPDFQVKRIHTMLKLNMLEEAEKAVDNLILNSPELYDGYDLKIKILIHNNELEKAVEFAQKAVEKFPEDVDLMQDYIRCLGLNGEYDKAIQKADNAKQMKYFDDFLEDFLMLEAELYAENNEFEMAAERCVELINMEAKTGFNGEARFMLMNMKLAVPDYKGAYEMAVSLIKADEGDDYYYAALYYRPFCLKEMGQNEDAKTFYEEANKIYRIGTLEKPEAIELYLYRSMCLKDIGEFDKALDILNFIFNLGLEVAEAYLLRSEIYRIQGKDVLAEQDRKKANELKPELNLNA